MKYLPLDDVEQRKLVRRMPAADAFDRLLSANWGALMGIAKRYSTHPRISLDDVLSEAIIGYHRGLMKYRESAGVRVLTYTWWWAMQGAQRYVDKELRSFRANKIMPRTPRNSTSDIWSIIATDEGAHDKQMRTAALIKPLVNGLTLPQQKLIEQRMSGLTWSEIGEANGESKRASRNRWTVAITQLREQLEGEHE